MKNQINKIAQNMEAGINYGDFIKNKPYPPKYKSLSNIYRVRVTDSADLTMTSATIRRMM
ncbi:MAG: hypothetical protein M3P08_08590 [Thermoproteota archaeon]|nr:hypothetical protein [Thermoproteota archaeon]